MDFDTFVLIGYLATVIALLAVLAQSRLYRKFPAFVAFLFFESAWGFASYALMQWWPHLYRASYLAGILIEAMLELTVLAELGRCVARSNRVSPPHPIVIALLLGLAALPLSLVAPWDTPAGIAPILTAIARSEQVVSLLRVAAILTLAFWSSLRRFRWPEDEFRIASGVSFYSIITFAVTVAETRVSWPAYRSLSRISVAAYLVTLFYWLAGFSRARRPDEVAARRSDDHRLPARGDRSDSSPEPPRSDALSHLVRLKIPERVGHK